MQIRGKKSNSSKHIGGVNNNSFEHIEELLVTSPISIQRVLASIGVLRGLTKNSSDHIKGVNINSSDTIKELLPIALKGVQRS
jgi:hypothetical protein